MRDSCQIGWIFACIFVSNLCFKRGLSSLEEGTSLKSDPKSQRSCYPDMTLSSCDRNMDIKSVHSHQIDEVHNVPISVLIRPIPSILDEAKVVSLMETIKVRI